MEEVPILSCLHQFACNNFAQILDIQARNFRPNQETINCLPPQVFYSILSSDKLSVSREGQALAAVREYVEGLKEMIAGVT